MLRAISSRLTGLVNLAIALTLVLTGFVASSTTVSAQGVPVDCSGVVANGGFENPTIPESATVSNGSEGWGGSYSSMNSESYAHSGVQFTKLSFGDVNRLLSQTLNTTGLSTGDTITISFWYDTQVGVTLGDSTVWTVWSDVFEWANATISYTLTSDEEPVMLAFTLVGGAQFSPYVDDVTASCTGREPVAAADQAIDVDYEGTFDGTLTATGGVNDLEYIIVGSASKGSISVTPGGQFTYFANPGQSGTDNFTFSATDSLIGELTDTGTVTVTIAAAPTPGPSPTPESDPIPDKQLSVTADPRFPITGSAAIDGYDDLTYALGSAPANGSVEVDANGQFSYVANNIWLSGDQFTVIATAHDGETATVTVTITYAIDKSVPTEGEVSPGGSNGGGNADDARGGDVSNPEPTSVPSDGGRVARP